MNSQNSQPQYSRKARAVVIISFVLMSAVLLVGIWRSFLTLQNDKKTENIWFPNGETKDTLYYIRMTPARMGIGLKINTVNTKDETDIELAKLCAQYFLHYALDYEGYSAAFPKKAAVYASSGNESQLKQNISTINNGAAKQLGFDSLEIELTPKFSEEGTSDAIYSASSNIFKNSDISKNEIQDVRYLHFSQIDLIFSSNYTVKLSTVFRFFKWRNNWYLSPEYCNYPFFNYALISSKYDQATTITTTIDSVSGKYIWFGGNELYFCPRDSDKFYKGQYVSVTYYPSYIGTLNTDKGEYEFLRIAKILPVSGAAK